MLIKGGKARPWPCDLPQPGYFLPFLYSTRTIQQRSYTRVSRGDKVTTRSERPNPRGWQPRSPDVADAFERPPRDRRDAGNGTGWRKLDLNNEIPRAESNDALDYHERNDWSPEKAHPFRRDERRTRDRGDARQSIGRSPAFENRTIDLEGSQTPGRSRREWSPRSADHVPFEKPEDTHRADLDLDTSTVTPKERAAFEKLFSLQKKTARDAGRGEDEHKGRKPVREPMGLDAILERAVANIKPREKPKPRFPDALRSMAEDARERQKTQRTQQSNTTEQYKEDAILFDSERVATLMDGAVSDIELWNLLNEHVLNRVAALGVDDITTPKQQAAARAWQRTQRQLAEKDYKQNRGDSAAKAYQKAPVSDLTILTANLPAQLEHFMTLMRTAFPSSILSLSLLPSLETCGPSAFALGVTTRLYNAHMRAMYSKYGTASLHHVVDTLREMDREVYDFDEETLALIIRIVKDARKYRYGRGGVALEALWRTESASRGVKSILNWRVIVEEKRQDVALRKAREEEAMRLAEAEDAEGAAKPETEGDEMIAAG